VSFTLFDDFFSWGQNEMWARWEYKEHDLYQLDFLKIRQTLSNAASIIVHLSQRSDSQTNMHHNCLEILLIHKFMSFHSRSPNSIGLGYCLRTCMSHKPCLCWCVCPGHDLRAMTVLNMDVLYTDLCDHLMWTGILKAYYWNSWMVRASLLKANSSNF
jgi:hypothetical protein